MWTMSLPLILLVVLSQFIAISECLTLSTLTNSLSRSFSFPESEASNSIKDYELVRYECDGWDLAYRYKPASKGYESQSPVVLVHPVGIGLSSWFWENLFREWRGPALYAPDLIGCGNSQRWDPDQWGLSFPLGWVQGIEGLLQEVTTTSSSITLPFLPKQPTQFTVVAQGGLAPVGVVLAARNPDLVSRLVLTSPPTWKDMTTAVPENELRFNSQFLSNPLFGNWAFGILEAPWAVRFFSNAFLFQNDCDDRWVEAACDEVGADLRPPVVAFNSGFCNHRSFEVEMTEMDTRVLILNGQGDRRVTERRGYEENMKQCEMVELPGTNVLPWESATETVEAIANFCGW